MGAFGVMIRILQYVGLYFQLNAALNVKQGEVDNGISGNGKLVYVCVLMVDWKYSIYNMINKGWKYGVQTLVVL